MSAVILVDEEPAAPAAAEAISPELVLVSPELRERALRQLQDVAWQSFLSQSVAPARARPSLSLLSLLRPAVLALVQLAVLGALVLLGTGAVTLVLTLVANATR